MGETFKPGDMVMIVKPSPCCGYAGRVGYFRTVVSKPLKEYIRCPMCGNRRKTTLNDVALDSGRVCGAYRLIKINPPARDTETERGIPCSITT